VRIEQWRREPILVPQARRYGGLAWKPEVIEER
jgi:hypothetical protein